MTSDGCKRGCESLDKGQISLHLVRNINGRKLLCHIDVSLWPWHSASSYVGFTTTGLMSADAGILICKIGMKDQPERPGARDAIVRPAAEAAKNCNRLAACCGALTD